MVPTGNKSIFTVLGILLGSLLAVACLPDSAVIEVSTTLATPTQIREPQPSRASLEPTYTPLTSSPTTSSTQQSMDPPSIFVVCDKTADSGTISETQNQQEGIPVEVDSLIPPAPPAKVSFSKSAEGIVLTWQGTGTDVDQSYNVYIQNQGEECWKLIGMELVEGDNQGEYSFEFTNDIRPSGSFFGVTTVDIYSNESNLSLASGVGTGP